MIKAGDNGAEGESLTCLSWVSWLLSIGESQVVAGGITSGYMQSSQSPMICTADGHDAATAMPDQGLSLYART